MNIIVMGAGYVGVTVAVVFAFDGHNVLLCEQDGEKLINLRRGRVPFYEPGLQEAYSSALTGGLRLAQKADKAAQQRADAAFVCVGTPLKGNGLDTAHVNWAVAQLRHLSADSVLAIKSTVPVGFCDSIKTAGTKVACVPEFLAQGMALHDGREPKRVIIGCRDEAALKKLARLYSGKKVITMLPAEAELVKLASNGYLAARLAYFGQVADYCDRLGLRYELVARAMGADDRIGEKYMDVGGGFGGSCLPKDSMALWQQSRANGSEISMLGAAISANDLHKHRVVEIIKKNCPNLKGGKIAVFSPGFKAGTTDTRNSPSIEIAQELLSLGAEVAFGNDAQSALGGAVCAVVISGYAQIKAIPADRIASMMRLPVIIDVGGNLDGKALTAAGIRYIKIGGTAKQPI